MMGQNMWTKRLVRTTAGLASVLSLLLVAPIAAANDVFPEAPTESFKESVTVTVPVRTITTPGTSGQNGILEMSVGNSAPLSVMIDTGSVGLRLWGGQLPGVTMTKKKVSSSLNGTSVPGLIGQAPMTLGGVTTTLAVPFQLINTSNPYIGQWKRLGISGILGIGVGNGQLTNPLVALPGELGTTWSVHFSRTSAQRGSDKGALILGARPTGNADLHFVLPYLGVNINGAQLWDDHAANGCWTFNGGREYCVPTWFDSGFTVMRIKGREFSRLPKAAVGSIKELRPGTRVALAAGNSAFTGAEFVAGRAASRNLARITATGSPTINTGNSFYFDYTVTYNVVTGDIYLTKPL
jgi:hypothetical protein